MEAKTKGTDCDGEVHDLYITITDCGICESCGPMPSNSIIVADHECGWCIYCIDTIYDIDNKILDEFIEELSKR